MQTQKISQASVEALQTLLTTASAVGVDTLIIGDSKIRGIDEKKTVGVVSITGVPDLDGKRIAFNRVKSLLSRINLVGSRGQLEVSATLAQNGSDIALLELSSGKSKSQFRCASVDAVKGVPQGFKDVSAWSITIPAAIVQAIIQADSSMGGDDLTIASRDGKQVTVEFIDANKDTFSLELDTEVERLSGDATSFSVKYWSKPLLALLREAAKQGDPKLQVGAQGLTQIQVNGLMFFTLPKA